MFGVKYVGPVLDMSGYAEACRNNILSIHKKGIPITIKPQCFERNPPPIANKEERDIIEALIDRKLDYSFLIIHLTPDLYPRFLENNVYTIGYMAWETTKLHPMWTTCCNSVNEAVANPSSVLKRVIRCFARSTALY